VTWSWFATALRAIDDAILLGLSCRSVVAAIVWFWRSDLRSAGAIGGSIALSLVTACLFGLGVPSLLHRLKLDQNIAAGPITLALADICALVLYSRPHTSFCDDQRFRKSSGAERGRIDRWRHPRMFRDQHSE